MCIMHVVHDFYLWYITEWNKDRKRGNNPQNIFDANYSNETKKKRKQVLYFNPNGVLDCPVVNKEQASH